MGPHESHRGRTRPYAAAAALQLIVFIRPQPHTIFAAALRVPYLHLRRRRRHLYGYCAPLFVHFMPHVISDDNVVKREAIGFKKSGG